MNKKNTSRNRVDVLNNTLRPREQLYRIVKTNKIVQLDNDFSLKGRSIYFDLTKFKLDRSSAIKIFEKKLRCSLPMDLVEKLLNLD